MLRTEIVDAAKGLLADTGSEDGVSIRAVAHKVGVTAPSIYRHFADKQALIDAVVADVFSQLGDEMHSVAAGIDAPLERLRQQGLAYVRFAREHPEQYRLATTQPSSAAMDVDHVLGSGAFTDFAQSIQDCIEAQIFVAGDPLPIALEFWAAAHGVASLQISKPFLPWGNPDDIADRVLRSAAVGHAVTDRLGDPTPAQFVTWLAGMAPG
ncbi:TetR/AcrR family transcriptional regulator [Antrihabitans cavernicola]|uniref:TetR/AcrR family transcriptional regulator n=1 Tax=Antrihabitans cavernicola TaxID=2495913 RepID=UPI001F241A83|nr:TetR/AcrR family transcriptional regulator [Spelaeibacter cavernicola]